MTLAGRLVFAAGVAAAACAPGATLAQVSTGDIVSRGHVNPGRGGPGNVITAVPQTMDPNVVAPASPNFSIYVDTGNVNASRSGQQDDNSGATRPQNPERPQWPARPGRPRQPGLEQRPDIFNRR